MKLRTKLALMPLCTSDILSYSTGNGAGYGCARQAVYLQRLTTLQRWITPQLPHDTRIRKLSWPVFVARLRRESTCLHPW